MTGAPGSFGSVNLYGVKVDRLDRLVNLLEGIWRQILNGDGDVREGVCLNRLTGQSLKSNFTACRKVPMAAFSAKRHAGLLQTWRNWGSLINAIMSRRIGSFSAEKCADEDLPGDGSMRR